MTLETASVSPKLAQEVLEQTLRQERVRAEILKSSNLKIHWDRQGKHIPGKHNFIPGRSVFEYPDPQKLVDKFAGTGLRDSSHLPGEPGYKEIINFGEVIGYDVHPRTGEITSTTWGKIHYGKDGVHIIPTRPR